MSPVSILIVWVTDPYDVHCTVLFVLWFVIEIIDQKQREVLQDDKPHVEV